MLNAIEDSNAWASRPSSLSYTAPDFDISISSSFMGWSQHRSTQSSPSTRASPSRENFSVVPEVPESEQLVFDFNSPLSASPSELRLAFDLGTPSPPVTPRGPAVEVSAFDFGTPSAHPSPHPGTVSVDAALTPNEKVAEYSPFLFGTPSPPPTPNRSACSPGAVFVEQYAFDFGSMSPPLTLDVSNGDGEENPLHIDKYVPDVALNIELHPASNPPGPAGWTDNETRAFDFGTPPTPPYSSIGNASVAPPTNILPPPPESTVESGVPTMRYPASTTRYIRYTFGSVDPGPAPWLTRGHDSSYVVSGPIAPSASALVVCPVPRTSHRDPSDTRPPSPIDLELVGFSTRPSAIVRATNSNSDVSNAPPTVFDFGGASPAPRPSELLNDYSHQAEPPLDNPLQLSQVVAHVLEQAHMPDSSVKNLLPTVPGSTRSQMAPLDRSSADRTPRQSSSVLPRGHQPVIVATQRYGGLTDPGPRHLYSYLASHPPPPHVVDLAEAAVADAMRDGGRDAFNTARGLRIMIENDMRYHRAEQNRLQDILELLSVFHNDPDSFL